ncbi:hypothetical protein D7316_00707 [Gordonia insulae]|uniref:DUF427 domain-containing protein n=2 Tax=Gordonia insulae TaxID=2420509 RepID=A0A3G8JGB4_9ACTN|nr:hypothetical protein D7316_00707 [Gordonia insulae]
MDHFTMSRLDELRWCAMHRRVRATVAGETVVDSADVRQVWEPHRVVGFYAVPVADIIPGLVEPTEVSPADVGPRVLDPDDAFTVHTCPGVQWTVPVVGRPLPAAAFTSHDPDLDGFVVLDWSAFDLWREEDQVVGGHPHDPFKRIDCLATSRHVVVTAGGVVVADSNRATLLLETYLPPRYYLPRDDVAMDLLVQSETRTTCAYKGHADYWSAAVGATAITDVAWSYADPLADGEPVRDRICFYDERVRVTVDGVDTAATTG